MQATPRLINNSGALAVGRATERSPITIVIRKPRMLTSLILDTHVMVSWQLSKQGIRWQVSYDYMAGSGLELIGVTCFIEFDRWPGAKSEFLWILSFFTVIFSRNCTIVVCYYLFWLCNLSWGLAYTSVFIESIFIKSLRTTPKIWSPAFRLG